MNRRGFFRGLLGGIASAALGDLIPAPLQDSRTLAQRLRDMDITTIQWEEMGGQKLNFKVMCLIPTRCWDRVPELFEEPKV